MKGGDDTWASNRDYTARFLSEGYVPVLETPTTSETMLILMEYQLDLFL